MPCLVSVIIPARDAALTVRRALASVLAQSYRPMEVIVVDDGSQDETTGVVRGIANPEVRLIQLPDARGGAAARKVGIETASSEIVAFPAFEPIGTIKFLLSSTPPMNWLKRLFRDRVLASNRQFVTKLRR